MHTSLSGDWDHSGEARWNRRRRHQAGWKHGTGSRTSGWSGSFSYGINNICCVWERIPYYKKISGEQGKEVIASWPVSVSGMYLCLLFQDERMDLLNMLKKFLFFIGMAVPVIACVAFCSRRRHYIVRQ